MAEDFSGGGRTTLLGVLIAVALVIGLGFAVYNGTTEDTQSPPGGDPGEPVAYQP